MPLLVPQFVFREDCVKKHTYKCFSFKRTFSKKTHDHWSLPHEKTCHHQVIHFCLNNYYLPHTHYLIMISTFWAPWCTFAVVVSESSTRSSYVQALRGSNSCWREEHQESLKKLTRRNWKNIIEIKTVYCKRVVMTTTNIWLLSMKMWTLLYSTTISWTLLKTFSLPPPKKILLNLEKRGGNWRAILVDFNMSSFCFQENFKI